jgi:peptide/nickel transport system ATP-binding protein
VPENLLEIRGLITAFHTDEGSLRAVDDVSIAIPKGATVGVVGESGCGKSVTALSVMRLVPEPPGKIEAGQILFEGRDLLQLSEREMRRLRGNDIAMIFQEPMTSLNPVYKVGDQIGEALRLHRGLSKAEAKAHAVALLKKVGIPAPEQRVDDYPHSLSGGMRQRVMIAMALACEPKLLIADEPTTALDVTIQAQILTLLRDLQRDTGMSVMLITHDLGVVAEVADWVVVMYAGRVVETARTEQLFADPRHPYTRGLLASLPGVRTRDQSATARQADGSRRHLATIRGVVPDLRSLPQGCRFRARCDFAMVACAEEEPVLLGSGEHRAACFLEGSNA